MTTFVKMKSAISKTRCIVDIHARDVPQSSRRCLCTEYLHREHLLDGLDRIVESAQTRCLHQNLLWSHIDCISLIRYKFIIEKYEASLRFVIFCGKALNSAHLRKFPGKSLYDINGSLISSTRVVYRCTFSVELSFSSLHIIWIRNNIKHTVFAYLSRTRCKQCERKK